MIIVAVVFVLIASLNAAYVQSLPTTRQITVQAYDFFFVVPGVSGNNPTIAVRTGDTIVLTLQNMGSKDDHEFFVLTQSNFNSYMAALKAGQNTSEPDPAFTNGSVEDVSAGQSKTGTFVVGQPGTYIYACLDKMSTDPLTHANDGMYGTLQVESGGLFSITKTLSSMVGNIFSSSLTSIPSIALWQAVIVLLLVALTKRSE